MLWTTDKMMQVAFWGMVSFQLSALLSFLNVITSCFAFPLIWGVFSATYLYLASLQLPAEGKYVMITGCDSGFGNALALHLDKLGFRVFAGCLFADANGEGAERLRKEGSDHLHVIQLDITKQEQLDQALTQVKTMLPLKEGLWALVNNAGLCTLGLVEWTPLEIFRRDPEINYFGTVASTKTFLPLVRRTKGRIVNVASMAGQITVPMMSSYSASKFAVEAFSESLRLEMKAWSVHVSIIEPGNYAGGTELFQRNERVKQEVQNLWVGLSEDLKADYGEKTCQVVENFMNSFRNNGRSDIMPVINALTEALTQVHPQARYKPQEPFMYFLVFVGNHFPEFVYDGCIAALAMLAERANKKRKS